MDWDQAYRAHHEQVFRYLYYRTSGDKDLSSDLAQDVFARAIKAQRQFTDRGDGLSPWLITIARNLLADHYKTPRRRREDLVDTVPDAAVASAETEALDQLAAETVMRAVAGLDADQREAVVLSYWGGWPDERIGQLMGVRARTVTTRRFRAREVLRRRLQAVT
jgi:RNA polymerase sigma-70 factor (ECF subfamily)